MSLTVELDEQTAAVVQKLAANEQRAKGSFLTVAARCPVCEEMVCVDRSTYHGSSGDTIINSEELSVVSPELLGDVEIDDLLVGDGTDLTVKDVFALTQLATSGA